MPETAASTPANGSATAQSTWLGHALRLAREHVNLGLLEARYEASQTGRRITALAAAGFAALTGYILLQIALVYGLMALGLSLGWATFVLAALYLIAAGLLVWRGGRRNPAVGEPFAGSRTESARTQEWIRKRFS